MSKPIKKIVVVGKDADAWITALFLKSGLNNGTSEVDIELIELPSGLSADDFYTVLPSIKNLHKVLGANEINLAKSAKAQHSFAQKFVSWSNSHEDFKHAYEKTGVDFNSVDFYQYWLKATKGGLKVQLDEFNAGAVATRHPSLELHKHLFTHKNPPNFGYHLSAQLYVGAVAKACIAAGIKRTSGTVKSVNAATGEITSIILSDDTEVTADLFIDASGSQRTLINELQTDNIDNWSDLFLCDRVITTSIQSFEPKPSFGLLTAFSSGWYGLHPLQDRTGMKICYSSKHATKAEVLHEVSSLLGLSFSDLPENTITCGMLKKSWIGNCIAVGNTVATLDNTDALDLQPLLLSLIELRALFPTTKACDLEAKIYNRHLTAYIENLRNFQLAHYILNGRDDEAFWNDCSKIKPSQQLLQKLQLFKSTGQIPIGEFETFQQENWTLQLHGHGLQPSQYHPLVDRGSDEELKQQFMGLLKKIGEDTSDLIRSKS